MWSGAVFIHLKVIRNDLIIPDQEQKPVQLSMGHSAYKRSRDTFLQTLSTAR